MGGKTNLEPLRKFFAGLSGKLGIQRVILFGSRVEGTGTKDSDYDFIIVSSKLGRLKFHERPARLYRAWSADAPADFLCFTPEEFNEKSKRVSIVSHAVKHGVQIF